MSADFNDLRTRLEELADVPAPASTFDPARVAAAGRRRVLAFRTSAIGGAGTLAVAATLGITTAFAPAAQPPATAGSGIGADPMAKFVDFGWLPASLPNVSYAATASATGNDVIAQGYKTPNGAPRVDLQLLPGNGPGTPNAHEHMIPVTLNDGRQAYWVTQSPTRSQFAGDFQLRFPAKDGRWISLSWSINWGSPTSYKIAGAPPSATAPTPPANATTPRVTDTATNAASGIASGTATASGPTATASKDSAPPTSVPVSAAWQQTLLHIATEVTDTPAQIPMPLQLTGLPPNFKPAKSFLWRPGQFGVGAPGTWSAMLTFFSGDLTASIVVGPHNTLAETAPPQAQGTECTTSAGLDACVQYLGSSPVFDELGGAKGLLKLVTLLGPDEKKWTTNVIVP